MKETSCPECDVTLKVKGTIQEGYRIVCPRCKTKLVIILQDPLHVEPVVAAKESAKEAVKAKKKSQLVVCPECEHTVKLNPRVRRGEQVVCTACHTRLEVVSIDPLELDLAVMFNSKLSRR